MAAKPRLSFSHLIYQFIVLAKLKCEQVSEVRTLKLEKRKENISKKRKLGESSECSSKSVVLDYWDATFNVKNPI